MTQIDELVKRLRGRIQEVYGGNGNVLEFPDDDCNEAADALESQSARVKELEDAYAKDDDEICQTLGKALGYPWFKDDQKNFPGATEASGVCVGEHVAASIASEAAAELTRLRERNAELEKDIVAVRDSFIDFCNVRKKEVAAAESRIASFEAELDQAAGVIKDRNADLSSLEATARKLREALTPSAETKAAYIGEFTFQIHDGYGDDGEDLYRKVGVPWTTIKEIMKAISARASESVVGKSEGES